MRTARPLRPLRPLRPVWPPPPVALAQVAAAGVVLGRLAPGARRRPALRPQPGRAVPKGTVSVVIPARDEEARIGPCLSALRDDPQVSEVIVVDDESTDGTAALAASLGARVLAGAELPPGWVGKPWALHQGLAAAGGEWVLTLDADVIPEPGMVGALLAAAVDEGRDVVSVGARFICRDPVQRWLHASMLATLVYRFGPVGPPDPLAPSRAIGNGQCLLVRRAWLLDRGGFAVTGGHMTDDIALVRWLAGLGASVAFLDGTSVVSVEMHRNVAEVWHQWGRSLAMADVTPASHQAADLAVIWLTMGAPVLRLAARRGTAVDVGLVLIRLLVAGAVSDAYSDGGAARQVARLPVWMSGLADPLTAIRLTQGCLRPTRSWRGRTYAAGAAGAGAAGPAGIRAAGPAGPAGPATRPAGIADR